MKKILLALSLLTSLTLRSQTDNILINRNYDNRYFIDLIKDLGKSTTINFFYDSNDIDSIKVVQNEVPASLNRILDSTLNNNYSYIINNNNVIITQDYKIDTSLPYYFTVDAFLNEKAKKEIVNADFLKEEEVKEKIHDDGIIKLGSPSAGNDGKQATVSGYIKESETGEPIIGCVVYIKDLEIGTVSDLYGYYVLSLPKGRYEIDYIFIGRKKESKKVYLYDNGSLNVNLKEELIELKGVVITAHKEHNVKGLQMGINKLDIKTLKQIPSSLGEVDLLKSALLLPGVQTVGEGASGFNVRGGSTDQNLILLDGAPIFNSSHLFGFFSAFNADIIREFKLYKSGIPAKYGSRIASVFDISVKNGDRKKISGSGGISPITSRLILEGPILNHKGSFVIGGRRTYSEWLLKKIDVKELKYSSASFYDFNAKLNYDINDNNTLMASYYSSSDYFRLNSDTTYNYKNFNTSINWKHNYSSKIYSTLSGIYSNYNYQIKSNSNPYNAFEIDYNIDYRELKTEFSYFPNENHTLNFGSSIIRYSLNPGSRKPDSELSIISELNLAEEKGIETALFFADEIIVTNRLSVNAGIRLSGFFVLGPDTVYDYNPNVAKSENAITDSIIHFNNDLIKFWKSPELRFSSRYKTGNNSSIKLSYSEGVQYIHMMSNTTAISPTDIWKMSDAYIPPQKGKQIALGYYQNLSKNVIEASVEVYYKTIEDIIDYKPGTRLILNPNLERYILNGIGKAYGVELLVKKKYGKLNGWIGYTYSSSKIKIDGPFIEEKINNGEYYPTNYDKPHDFTLVSNYKFTRRFSVSSNVTYSTGRPITLPVSKFFFRDRQLVHYSERNQFRIPDYFRWDLSLNIEGSHKRQKLAHSSLSISVYNVTGRDNVYSIYFISNPRKQVNAYKLSVFAYPIPTVTYNFKF